jgi:hypothetical protein
MNEETIHLKSKGIIKFQTGHNSTMSGAIELGGALLFAAKHVKKCVLAGHKSATFGTEIGRIKGELRANSGRPSGIG